jgi:hypothetical protein
MATTTIEASTPDARAQIDVSQYDFANLEPYVHPPETKADLPWSELVTLDLEDYHRPGGKERLAKQLEHAVHHVGFVCSDSKRCGTHTNVLLVLCKELRPDSRTS